MKYLYLVRHGLPVPKEFDATKPLSAEGRRDVEKVAEFLKKSAIRPEIIYHSGKKRAMQTAEIINEKLKLDRGPLEKEGVSPLDDLGIIAGEVAEGEYNLMIVGHLPHLAKLTSWLVTGNESETVVDFKQGSVVCLQKDDDRKKWLLSWIIVPALLKD